MFVKAQEIPGPSLCLKGTVMSPCADCGRIISADEVRAESGYFPQQRHQSVWCARCAVAVFQHEDWLAAVGTLYDFPVVTDQGVLL